MKIAIIVIVLIIVVITLGHSRAVGADPTPPPPPSSPGQSEHQRMLEHVNNYCDNLAAHVPGYHCVHDGVTVDGPS